MKKYMYLIPMIAGIFTILNYIIKFLKWTIENEQKTMKYSSLTTAILMSFSAGLFLILSACVFYLKMIATNSLESAFTTFFICITMAIGSLLFANYYYKEYKNYNIIPK